MSSPFYTVSVVLFQLHGGMVSHMQVLATHPIILNTWILTTETILVLDVYEIAVIGERDTLRSVQLKIGDIIIYMVSAISDYSAGVSYAARFTAAVKIPLPLATFQF